jgi:hypothetical protein
MPEQQGQVLTAHHPNRLSLAFSDADDFTKLVRSLPKDIPGS